MIEAIIFDMDGVILDSEPLWQDAEMEIFASVGVPLTRQQCIEMTGLPTRDVVALCYAKNPWKSKSTKQVEKEIIDRVEELILEKSIPLQGVLEVMRFLKAKNLPLALASSSPLQLIRSVVKKFAMEDVFTVIHSAEKEQYGKPHPAVFLETAHQLKKDPVQCLVIEDSFNGLIAAKAARMKTVVLPMSAQWHETRFDIADVKLKSLTEFDEKTWNFLNR